jgi:hypothetical protein
VAWHLACLAWKVLWKECPAVQAAGVCLIQVLLLVQQVVLAEVVVKVAKVPRLRPDRQILLQVATLILRFSQSKVRN